MGWAGVGGESHQPGGFWGEFREDPAPVGSPALGPGGLSVAAPQLLCFPSLLAAFGLQTSPELFPPGKAGNPKHTRLL